MSKITNDGITRSGTGCFTATHMARVGVKGLIHNSQVKSVKSSYRPLTSTNEQQQ